MASAGCGATSPDADFENLGAYLGRHKRNRRVLESKQHMTKRAEASPDDADALALTWAQRVDPPVVTYTPPKRFGEYSWMG